MEQGSKKFGAAEWWHQSDSRNEHETWQQIKICALRPVGIVLNVVYEADNESLKDFMRK
jgi:hypothetical protein